MTARILKTQQIDAKLIIGSLRRASGQCHEDNKYTFNRDMRSVSYGLWACPGEAGRVDGIRRSGGAERDRRNANTQTGIPLR